MRHATGCGTPRGLQGRGAAVIATVLALIGVVRPWFVGILRSSRVFVATREPIPSRTIFIRPTISNRHLRHGLLTVSFFVNRLTRLSGEPYQACESTARRRVHLRVVDATRVVVTTRRRRSMTVVQGWRRGAAAAIRRAARAASPTATASCRQRTPPPAASTRR
jgi:hypothetical protein